MHEMQETQFLSLGWKDPLEKEMATHSSILAGVIPWTERILGGLQSMGPQRVDKEPGGLQSMGSQRARHSWVTELVYMHTQAAKTSHACSGYPASHRRQWLQISGGLLEGGTDAPCQKLLKCSKKQLGPEADLVEEDIKNGVMLFKREESPQADSLW